MKEHQTSIKPGTKVPQESSAPSFGQVDVTFLTDPTGFDSYRLCEEVTGHKALKPKLNIGAGTASGWLTCLKCFARLSPLVPMVSVLRSQMGKSHLTIATLAAGCIMQTVYVYHRQTHRIYPRSLP